MKITLSVLCSLFFFSHIEGGMPKDGNNEEVFSYVYDNGLWGYNEEDGSPSSGWGSWMAHVKPYKDYLEKFLKENHIKSVVDVGCGDWTFSRHICWDQINYVGIDVVKSVIAKNQKEFTKPNITFVQKDIVNAELPGGELLICKDVLQHLSNADVAKFLSKIKKYKHCLITNDIVVGDEVVKKENRDLPGLGQNRALDLTKAPFNLKAEKVLTFRPREDHVKQVLYIRNE